MKIFRKVKGLPEPEEKPAQDDQEVQSVQAEKDVPEEPAKPSVHTVADLAEIPEAGSSVLELIPGMMAGMKFNYYLQSRSTGQTPVEVEERGRTATDVFPSLLRPLVEWINLNDTVCYARKPARMSGRRPALNVLISTSDNMTEVWTWQCFSFGSCSRAI